MGKKRDLHINYEKTYRKHKRSERSKTKAIIVVIILAVGIGTASYFGAMRSYVTGTKKSGNTPNQTLTMAANDPTHALTLAPTSLPTQIPTEVPTIQPTKAVEPDNRIPVKVKGIYITAPTAGTNLLDNLITLVDTTQVNAMVINVKDDSGRVTYDMDYSMAQEIGATSNIIPDMKTLLDTLKAKNIYLIARIVSFKDPLLADKRQELAIKKKDGTIFRDDNGQAWVNPYKKEVWNYLLEIAKQAAVIGFDEIQFDYIRFSTSKGLSDADFGEDSKTVGKEDIITEFTSYVYDNLKPLGVFVSADVYGTIISSKIDASHVGQNFVEMSKHLDYICPMIYPSHFGEGNYGVKYPDLDPYNIIRKVLTAAESDLAAIPEGEHRAIVRPWLQAFTATWIPHYQKYGPEQIKDQINGVYSAGYDEWILWNAVSHYEKDWFTQE